jgi:hypothetical protein
MAGPDVQEFHDTFARVAEARGLSCSAAVIDVIIDALTSNSTHGLAFFQPKFICDQVQQVCRCFGFPPVITRELAERALANLYVKE